MCACSVSWQSFKTSFPRAYFILYWATRIVVVFQIRKQMYKAKSNYSFGISRGYLNKNNYQVVQLFLFSFNLFRKLFVSSSYYVLSKIHCPISYFQFSSICWPPKLYLDCFYNSQKLKSSKFVMLKKEFSRNTTRVCT